MATKRRHRTHTPMRDGSVPPAPTRKRKRIKVQLANISLSRNGLTMELQGVPVADLEALAREMLDVTRRLVKAGYGELIVDAGSLHSGALGEMPDEDGIDQWSDPAQLPAPKRVGFTTA